MTESDLVFLLVVWFYASIAAVFSFTAVVLYTKIETGYSFTKILKEI